jgi:hypothetical protein
LAAVEGEPPIDDDCHGRWFLLCGQYSIQTTRIQFEHMSIEKDNGGQRLILSTRRNLTIQSTEADSVRMESCSTFILLRT